MLSSEQLAATWDLRGRLTPTRAVTLSRLNEAGPAWEARPAQTVVVAAGGFGGGTQPEQGGAEGRTEGSIVDGYLVWAKAASRPHRSADCGLASLASDSGGGAHSTSTSVNGCTLS